MKLIMLSEFGSTIYGTKVPTSDTDYKGISLPTAREILLQKVPKTTQQQTKKDSATKNTAEDVDTEIFGFSTYIRLLLENQTSALDLLFAPTQHHRIAALPEWDLIWNNKEKFLHKGVGAFTGYCRTQAQKYGLKGGRVAAVRKALEFLKVFPDTEIIQNINYSPIEDGELIKTVVIKAANGVMEPHLEVCNRKIPFHAKVKYARDVFQRIFDNHGQRAIMAETNQGVDWKATMHAVRVCHEAEELLLIGNITFPRPEKDLLLKIRKGELPYKEVGGMIEEGLERVEAAQVKSTLPETPNYKFADSLIESVHEAIIVNNYMGD